MAKIVDPHNLPDRKLSIPGLKPPVCADQLVTDDGDRAKRTSSIE